VDGASFAATVHSRGGKMDDKMNISNEYLDLLLSTNFSSRSQQLEILINVCNLFQSLRIISVGVTIVNTCPRRPKI
jgi:hypothetical protein